MSLTLLFNFAGGAAPPPPPPAPAPEAPPVGARGEGGGGRGSGRGARRKFVEAQNRVAIANVLAAITAGELP
jgi:hypothetical protein